MMRRHGYRPRVVALEERSVPGTVLTSLDPSLFLAFDPTLLAASRDAAVFDRASMEAGIALHTSDFADVAPVPGSEPIANSAPLGALGSADASLGALDLASFGSHQHQGRLGADGGDLVTLGVLTGSYIQIGSQGPYNFGDDQGSTQLQNVFITNDGTGAGTLFVAQSDIHLPSVSGTISGFNYTASLLPLSDGTGTYDRNTGNASASLTVTVQLQSNAPGFHTCSLPGTTITITTDNGVPFSNGGDGNDYGTMADVTFPVPAMPHGSCGSFIFIGDYADLVNSQFSLPSPSGNNVLNINILMNPAIGP